MSRTTPIPLCALIVGHERTRPGATSYGGVSEYAFNSELASQVALRVRPTVCRVQIMFRNEGGYGKLPGRVNATGADFAIEMHFNAANTKARGTEVLYWHRSEDGKRLAWQLNEKFARALGNPDRGIKPRDIDGRGGYLLGHTRMPCVIAEPFFGDNKEDWNLARDNKMALAQAYASGIEVQAAWLSGSRAGHIDLLGVPAKPQPTSDSES